MINNSGYDETDSIQEWLKEVNMRGLRVAVHRPGCNHVGTHIRQENDPRFSYSVAAVGPGDQIMGCFLSYTSPDITDFGLILTGRG